MAVEGVSSDTYLRNEIYKAACDGKAATIIEIFRKSNRCNSASGILDYHTEENGQTTTPLIIAAIKGHEHVVLVLLRLGAKIEQTGTVVIYEHCVKGATPLWCAAAIGHLGLVKLLVEYGANVNSQTASQSTPLRAACFDGHLSIVKFLVERGALINVLTKDSNNCLSLACSQGHYTLTEYLIGKGADMNQKNENGWTALHGCAKYGHVKIIELLLQHGAKITTNDDNNTPLMTAALNGNTDTVEYFITQTNCSMEERADALELLGTTFALIKKHQDMERAYGYLQKAMEERNKFKNLTEKHIRMLKIAASDNGHECRNLSELEAIKTNHNALKMECLAKRQRILGPGHPGMIKAIVYVGDYFIDNHEYTKGLNFWHYALTQYRDTHTYTILWFPNTLAYVMEMNQTFEPNTVLDAFQIFTDKLESCLLQIKGRKCNVDFLHETCEDITIDCVHLVAILLTMYTNTDGLEIIHHLVYKFLKLEPHLRNGFTPLHMCCSTTQYTEYDPLLNVVQFPNTSLCKTFIRCGSNVNARDNKTNTPLHTIAKCAESLTDFDTLNEILCCLIKNGAHLDMRNKDNKTAADMVDMDVVKSILRANTEISLKCLAATAVRKHGDGYKGVVTKDIQEFIELH